MIAALTIVMAPAGAGATSCAPQENIVHVVDGRPIERNGDDWTFVVDKVLEGEAGSHLTVTIGDGRPSPYGRYRLLTFPLGDGVGGSISGECPSIARIGLALPATVGAAMTAPPLLLVLQAVLVIAIALPTAVWAQGRIRRSRRPAQLPFIPPPRER